VRQARHQILASSCLPPEMAFSRVGASCSLASRRLISVFQSGIAVLPSAFDLLGVFRPFSFGDAQIGEVRDRSCPNP
jgi:hypothetical protein